MSKPEHVADVRVKSILMATDFSAASAKPLRHALAVARHFGAKLYVVHVVSSVGFTIAGAEALRLASSAAFREILQLQSTLAESGALAGLSHEFIVRQGDVCRELGEIIRQKEIDLVIIGTHARRGMEKLLLGSVAEHIFRDSDRPVLTVGPHSPEGAPFESTDTVHSFLFPTDFGAASLRALRYAVSFANHFGAKLVLLHVAPVMPVPETFHWSTAPNDIEGMREAARAAAMKNLHHLVTQAGPLSEQPECIVRFGKRAETILQVARGVKADLIVVGLNHLKHADAVSHMPQTTAYRVVCSAHCSVLTVRS